MHINSRLWAEPRLLSHKPQAQDSSASASRIGHYGAIQMLYYYYY